MLAAADQGMSVVSVDNFDPDAFISDPASALLEETGDQTIVDRIFAVSDVRAQVPLVQTCLQHPNIQFERRLPTYQELTNAIRDDSGVLTNVNARALTGRDGYAGHVVVLHRLPSMELRLEDPGPPAHEGMLLEKDRFLSAWHSPTPAMANYIKVSLTT